MKPLLDLPSRVLNGVAVALGMGPIQLLVGSLAGAQAAAALSDCLNLGNDIAGAAALAATRPGG
ncbi:MAG TPA: hypothetical protein PLO41_08915 [Rubrivivax sp.]|nr:hypothetical protein [Rubrivivax sp.]